LEDFYVILYESKTASAPYASSVDRFISDADMVCSYMYKDHTPIKGQKLGFFYITYIFS
jgi:hypothetical protein